MSKLNANRISGVGIGLSALVIAGAAAYQSPAQRQMENAPANDGAPHVGVVAVDRVFEAYPGMQEFNQQAQSLQQKFTEAQQTGDQQRQMEIQQQYAELRTQFDAEFRRDLEEVARKVARDKGVRVIAAEVIYRADDVQDVDLTPDLVEAMRDDADSD